MHPPLPSFISDHAVRAQFKHDFYAGAGVQFWVATIIIWVSRRKYDYLKKHITHFRPKYV